MNRSHCAKYMILVGPTEAPRALLFNGEHRYLAEVFDDEQIVLEHLMKHSQACPPPRGLALNDVVPPPSVDRGAMRCFALG